MSEISSIDSEKLLSTANQLEGIIDRMNTSVGKFSNAIENLDKGWKSEVKITFMANYQKDWEAMQEMLMQLREISNGLSEAASDFDKTEYEILSNVNVLVTKKP